MAQERVYLTSPVGRFVMGDAFAGSDKDQQGRVKLDKTGKPKMTWFMGLAIRKDDPQWGAFWGQIAAIAQRDFPNGAWQAPAFAWKVVDGDAKYPDRAECRGCYIVRFSSGFAPTAFNAQNQQIVDPTQCKRGDYVRVYMSVQGNDDQTKPGVYLNHTMIQVVGYGEAILSGPSAAQVFAQPAALPPGASAHPVAPSAPMPAAPMAAPGFTPPPAYAPSPGAPVPTAPVSAPPSAPAYAPPAATGYPSNPPAAAPVYAAPPPAAAPYPQIMNGPGGPTR